MFKIDYHGYHIQIRKWQFYNINYLEDNKENVNLNKNRNILINEKAYIKSFTIFELSFCYLNKINLSIDYLTIFKSYVSFSNVLNYYWISFLFLIILYFVMTIFKISFWFVGGQIFVGTVYIYYVLSGSIENWQFNLRLAHKPKL